MYNRFFLFRGVHFVLWFALNPFGIWMSRFSDGRHEKQIARMWKRTVADPTLTGNPEGVLAGVWLNIRATVSS